MNTRQFFQRLAEGWWRFAGAKLRGADLRGANMQRLDLHRADLRGARLDGADLRGARLEDANLRGARLRGADMTGADLRGANVTGADWTDATLRGAHLDTGELAIIEEQGGIRSMTGVNIFHRPSTLLCQQGACPELGTKRCRICTVPLCQAHVRQLASYGVVCPLCEHLYRADRLRAKHERRRERRISSDPDYDAGAGWRGE